MSEDLTVVRVAYLALGSNLGDRAANLAEATRRIGEHPHVDVLSRASVFATAPMYVEEQPEFLNTCIEVRTTLDPYGLLDVCLDVERGMGRVRLFDNGPRNIDVDIILFEDIVIDDDRLTVPHAAMLERDFVLIPLAEIAADRVHPVTGRTVSEERDRRHDGSPQEPVDDERDVAQ